MKLETMTKEELIKIIKGLCDCSCHPEWKLCTECLDWHQRRFNEADTA